MELRQLRYFEAVARRAHFRAAASDLNVAQPALSQQVRRLEEELGVRLFDRTSRSVRLTLAGERLLTRARTMIAEADNARAEMDELRGASWGQLRIGVVNNSGLDAFGLPELLAEFSGRYPEARTHIRNGASLALFDWLLQGRVQLAFVTLTDVTKPPEGILLEPFLVADIGAIVPLSHRLAGEDVAPLHVLAGERLILFGNAAMIRDRLLAEAGELAAQLDVVHQVGDGRMLRALAGRELGVGIGPRWCVGPDDRELVFVPLHPPLKMTIAIAWADRYYRPPAVRALLDLAEQRLLADE